MSIGTDNSLPRRLMNIWLLLTMFLFFFGPINYNCNKLYAILYMFAFLIVANFFYYLGIRVKTRTPRRVIPYDNSKIISICIVYSTALTILFFFEAMIRYGFKSFSLTNIISQMATTYTVSETYSFMITAWIMSYTKWVRVIALVLGSLYWKSISRKMKVLYITMCVVIVIHNTLYVGSQKELIDLAVYIISPIIIKWTRESRHISFRKKAIVLVGIVLFAVFLGSVIASRYELWVRMYNSNASIGADYNNWVYKILPRSIADAISYLVSYITQGYRGLSLCLTLPFKWTFGMGSSFKFMNDVSRWFSIPIDVLEQSYPVRMQSAYGVGAYASWHTIFPWIASDFTFAGAIFVVSIYIFYWAKSWREAIHSQSWIAPIMFSQLNILVLFIPCNNQLFQTRDSIVASIVIFLLWYFFHGMDVQQIK